MDLEQIMREEVRNLIREQFQQEDCKSVYTGSIPVLASSKIPKALPDTRSLNALIELLQFNG